MQYTSQKPHGKFAMSHKVGTERKASSRPTSICARGATELSTEIDVMIQRLQTASSSLTSNMSLLDRCPRSIADDLLPRPRLLQI